MKNLIFIAIIATLFGCSEKQKESAKKSTDDVLGISAIRKSKEAREKFEKAEQKRIDELDEIE